MNRNERQLALPWQGSKRRRRTGARQITWRFGDRERSAAPDLTRKAAGTAARLRRRGVEAKPLVQQVRAADHRSAELALRLPKHISLGLIRPMRDSESFGGFYSTPLLSATGLLATSPVPNERETLWELLSLGRGERAVLVLDPAVSTPIFPHHPVADALPPRLGHRGSFNPHFLDPALFRQRIFPVLSELASVVDGELTVLITIPALLRAADIPPFPLLWRLERLATVVPSDIRIAIELREADYLTDDFAAFLGESGWTPVISSWLDARGWERQWALTRAANERIVRIHPRSSVSSPRNLGLDERFSSRASAFSSVSDPGLRRRLASQLLDSDGLSTVLVDSDPGGEGHHEVLELAGEIVDVLGDSSSEIDGEGPAQQRPANDMLAES